MSRVRTYDAKRVVITIGAHTVTGYGEDTFVSIEPQGDGTAAIVGADGEVARSMSNNPLEAVNLTLLQTSPTNDYLSALLERDRASGGGGIVPLSIRDLNGTTVVTAGQAWVVNHPTVEYGAAVNEREWQLMAVVNSAHVGGNA